MRGGEIHIELRPNPSGAGFGFWLTTGSQYDLFMAFNPGLPVSLLAPGVRDDLLRGGLLQTTARAERYRLPRLTVDGQPLPDLEVHVSRRLARLGLDGMVGLDLLFHFEHVHFHVPTWRLSLQNPTNGSVGP